MRLTTLCLAAAIPLQGCFFIYLPGSAMDSIGDAFTGAEGKLRVNGDKLYVPQGTRIFTQPTTGVDAQRNGGYAFGTPESLHNFLHKQANLSRIELHASGNTALIKSASGCTPMMDKVATIRCLTEEHGIYGGQAMQLLREAKRAPHSCKSFLLKYAAAYDSGAYGNADRPFQGGPSGKQEYATRTTQNVVGGKALSGAKDADGQPLIPDKAIERAMEAADAGITEVFDVSVLSGLIDKADVSELRKDYVSDMIKGMDKIGRMLFLYYWHHDEFEERYGKEDMQKLEDTLKEVFLSTGDLVLFLKEKTAYTPDAAESLFGSLSEDVASAG